MNVEKKLNEIKTATQGCTSSQPKTVDGVPITAVSLPTIEDVKNDTIEFSGKCKVANIGILDFTATYNFNPTNSNFLFKYLVNLDEGLTTFVIGGDKNSAFSRKLEGVFPNIFKDAVQVSLMRTNTIKVFGDDADVAVANYITLTSGLTKTEKDFLEMLQVSGTHLNFDQVNISFSHHNLQWDGIKNALGTQDVRIYASISGDNSTSISGSDVLTQVSFDKILIKSIIRKQDEQNYSYSFGAQVSLRVTAAGSFPKTLYFFNCDVSYETTPSSARYVFAGSYEKTQQAFWKSDFFGLPGKWAVKQFDIRFQLDKAKKVANQKNTMVFSGDIVLQNGDGIEITGGVLLSKAKYGLYGSVGNFTFSDVEKLFKSTSGQELANFGDDVTFKEVSLGYASADDIEVLKAHGDEEAVILKQGWTANCKISVDVDGWGSFDSIGAQLLINADRVRIEGYIKDVEIEGIQGFKIDKTYLLANIGRKGGSSAGSKGFALGADATYKDFQFELEIIKITGADSNLIAIGKLSLKDGKLESLVPSSVTDALNLSTYSQADVGAIYAQKQEGESVVSQYIEDFPYGVEPGFSVFASLTVPPGDDGVAAGASGDSATKMGGISALNGKSESKGFGFFATLQPAMILYFTDSHFKLTGGCEISKLYFKIMMPFELQFIVEFQATISEKKWKFDLEVDLDLLGAAGVASVKGTLTNLFGIHGLDFRGMDGGDGTLSVGLEVLYAQIVTTGLPSGFYFALDSLYIGDIGIQVAVNINEDPKKELIFGELDGTLSPSTIINSMGEVLGISTHVSDGIDFFVIENLKIYICTATMSIGGRTWEKGWQFKGSIELFKIFDLYVNISMLNGTFTIQGIAKTVDLGFLKITCDKTVFDQSSFAEMKSSIEASGAHKDASIKKVDASKLGGKAKESVEKSDVSKYSSKDDTRATILQKILADPGPFVDIVFGSGDFHVAMSTRIVVSILGNSEIDASLVITSKLFDFHFKIDLLSIIKLECHLKAEFAKSFGDFSDFTLFFSVAFTNDLQDYIVKQCTKAINEGLQMLDKSAKEAEDHLTDLQNQYTAQEALTESFDDSSIHDKMEYYKQQSNSIDNNVRDAQKSIDDAIGAIDDINDTIGESINSGAWGNAISQINSSVDSFNSLIDSATKSRNSAIDDIKTSLTKVVNWHKKIAGNPFVRHNLASLKKSINRLYKKKKVLKRDYQQAVAIYKMWKKSNMDPGAQEVQKSIVKTSFNIYSETERQFSHLTGSYHQLKSLLKSMEESSTLTAALLKDKAHYDALKLTNLVDMNRVNSCVSNVINNINHIHSDYDKTLKAISADLETSRKILSDFKDAINEEAVQAHKAVNAAQKGAVIAYDNWNYTMRCLRNSFAYIALQVAKDFIEVGTAIVDGLGKIAEAIIDVVFTEIFCIRYFAIEGQVSTSKSNYLKITIALTVVGIHIGPFSITIDLGKMGDACSEITSKSLTSI